MNEDSDRDFERTHRRRRIRRRGRRAYIRSVYFLPSMATLGNAICGFGAMYIVAMDSTNVGHDPWAIWLSDHKFLAAAYLIFFAMIFDALDGRLARFARHTTDFGGQLDSLADVISFGAAPAFISLLLIKSYRPDLPFPLSRLIWAIGALYFSCAALRLARFNVSNEHGEQAHFSFLGLPSPGAAGTVAGIILMQQELALTAKDYIADHGNRSAWLEGLSSACVALIPILLLVTGLLMVSNVRYPHVVNRHMRGRRSIGRLVFVLVLLLLLIVAHRYAVGMGMSVYVVLGIWAAARRRRHPAPAVVPAVDSKPEPRAI